MPNRLSGAARWTAAALFLLINGVVFDNARNHDPRIGYDSIEHILYMQTLARGRLPRQADTNEFFSPPLPYAPGALAMGLGVSPANALRTNQYAQVAFSIMLTWFLLRLARTIKRDDPWLGVFALACLGIIPTYYKTFAMIRGEPLLATCCVVAAWLAIRTFATTGGPTIVWGALLGLAMGAAILSRQWGFFLVPPVVILAFWRMWRERSDHHAVAAAARSLSAALVVMFVSGGWYYVHLYRAYGTITAFNRPAATHKVARSPAFYVTYPPGMFVGAPAQDHYHPRYFLPIMYSDMWGDYWLNFLVYGKDGHGQYLQGSKVIKRAEQFKPAETNIEPMLRYLGRVNVVSIVPTLLLFAGLIAGVVTSFRSPRADMPATATATMALAAAIVLFTFAGYLLFVFRYTDPSCDTIKACYLLQTAPFLALLAAALLGRITDSRPRATIAIMAVLMLIWVHNLPAMLTHYPTPPHFTLAQ